MIHFKGVTGNEDMKYFHYELDGIGFTVNIYRDSDTDYFYYQSYDVDGKRDGDKLLAKGFPSDGTIDTYLFGYQHALAVVIAHQFVNIIKKFIEKNNV